MERWIQSIQVECLDHFIVLGTGHLSYLTSEYVDYYNRQRPHSAIEFRAPAEPAMPRRVRPPEHGDPLNSRDLGCEQRLGGLIRHYHRKAA